MLPFLLAAAGGYLIGSSLKSKQYADGGKVKTYTDAELLEKFKIDIKDYPTYADWRRELATKASKEGYQEKKRGIWTKRYMADDGIMAHGGDIRKIKGNNFSQQIENGQRFKAIIQKVFDDQKGDRIYPLEYIKATALTPHPIVKMDGKNYVSGDAYKGTYSHYEFMDDPNFIKALEYVDRPKIRAKFEDGGNLPSTGDIIPIADIDYDMMDYLSRTNKELLVTMKNGEKVKASVGKFYNDLIFHGDFPKDVQYINYSLQKKYFDKIEITN